MAKKDSTPMRQRKRLFLTCLALLMAGCAAPPGTSVATNTSSIPSTPTNPAPIGTADPAPIASLDPTLPPMEEQTPDFSSTDKPLGKPLIALVESNTWDIYLQDVSTGTTRRLQFSDSSIGSDLVISWSKDGCELFIERSEGIGDLRILRVDLQGVIQGEIFSAEQFVEEGFIQAVTVSPIGDMIAYRVGTGERLGGYDVLYEFEDIVVVGVDSNFGPYQLTLRGGARDIEWSPDGSMLAYSDYDSEGIHQLYKAEPDGNGRVQLTNFTEESREVLEIQWSPDGKSIAFVYQTLDTPTTQFKEDLVIMSVDGANHLIRLTEGIFIIRGIWWQEPDIVTIHVNPVGDPAIAEDDVIYWIDSSSGQVVEMLRESDTPEGHFVAPGPLGTTKRIGYFSFTTPEGAFYIYDVESRSSERKDLDKIISAVNWTAAPESFSGETLCRQ